MEDKVYFELDNGETAEFTVLEETKVNGIHYLLVSDAEDEDEEGDAYILKDISKAEETEAVYQMIDDGDELEYIGRIFSELLDDIDLV